MVKIWKWLRRIWVGMVLLTVIATLCVSGYTLFVLCKTRGGYDGSFAADQYNTTWRTEDGRIVFHVGEDCYEPIRCFINTEQGTVEVTLSLSRFASRIEIADPEAVEELEENESFPGFAAWRWTDWDETTLVVTVEETKYLEPGKELVFHRDEPET